MPSTQIRLDVHGAETTLTLREDGDVLHRVTLPWSWQSLRERFVRHAIPTEAEVEYAINFIEDELAKIPDFRRRDHGELQADAPVLRAVFAAEAQTAPTRSRDAVEALFSRYAFVARGRSPAQEGLEVDAERFIALLVVREMLHHLGYVALRLDIAQDGTTE